MSETKRKVGRPEGKKRGAITLSLPLDLVEWLRSTRCPSQIVEDLVRQEIKDGSILNSNLP